MTDQIFDARIILAFASAGLSSLISFLGVVFLAFVNVHSLRGPLEYLSLAFAGTVLIGDACMHLIPHCIHDHHDHGHQDHDHHHDEDHHDHDHHHDHTSSFLQTQHENDHGHHHGDFDVGLYVTMGALFLFALDIFVSECCSSTAHSHDHHGSSATTTKNKVAAGESSIDHAKMKTRKPSRSSSPGKKKRSVSRSRGRMTSEMHEEFPSQPLVSFGWANLVVEALHNFVDGVALGVAWLSAPGNLVLNFSFGKLLVNRIGLNTAIAIFAHEIPQELGDFQVLKLAGFPVKRLLFYNFLVSLTCILGVAFVVVIQESSAFFVDIDIIKKKCMALTAGTFLSLSLYMIFPQMVLSVKKHHPKYQDARIAYSYCAVTAAVAIGIVKYIGELEAFDFVQMWSQ